MNRRVYQVAREQGLTSRELLARLQAAGVDVTTASSNVDLGVALRVLGNGNGMAGRGKADIAVLTGRRSVTGRDGSSPATGASRGNPAGNVNGGAAAGRGPRDSHRRNANPPAPAAAGLEKDASADAAAVAPPKAKASSVGLSFSATLLVVVALSALVGWGLSHVFRSTNSWSSGQAAAGAPSSSQSPSRGWSTVAVAKFGQLTVYQRPDGQAKMLTLGRPVSRQPLTLLVKQRRTAWVQAYLPMRPNGVLGWVRRAGVRLVTDPWQVIIEKQAHRMVVKQAGQVIRRFPIAVGKPTTPTPAGHFFITELLKQPDPAGAYGPYAFGTSDFSNVIKQFGNGGNGQIGIHGTDEPWVIGTSASHGCIRLYNRDIVWLAQRLPLGTPVKVRG